jgi:5-methyltetrahydrofolate--homocysteine methyltransferase
MPRPNLLDELKKRPLLCDGGMGTQLQAAGLAPGACGEQWNVDRPEVIEKIQRAYRDAGCELITTATFGGTRGALDRHGLGDRTQEISRASVGIARRVCGDDAWVLGDIAPFGGFIEPLGETTPEEANDMFVEQAAALHEAGADAAVVETMTDPAELEIAVAAARSVGDWPIIATCAFDSSADGTYRTMMGADPETALRRALDAGADVIGANCGTSMELSDYVALAREIVALAGDVPVIIQPNAGAPQMIDGEIVYAAQPEDMAGIVGPFLVFGVRIVGGCCGTTPDHLKAMGEALAAHVG